MIGSDSQEERIICDFDSLLTLSDWAHDVGLNIWVEFKHRGKTLASKFSGSLATMAIKNGKAAVVAGSFEVVLDHKL